MTLPGPHCNSPRTARALRPSRGPAERRGSPPRMDPRLHPFDPRQLLPWRIFFRRLALRFRGLTIPAAPVHDYNGNLVGD